MRLSARRGPLTIAWAAGTLLAACNGSYAPSYGALPLVVAQAASIGAPSNHALMTAWGRVVDDPSGKPLARELVKLEPWKPCKVAGNTLRCPAAVAVTHTRLDGKFFISAPPGHYLLIIGSDSPADPRPTIHDDVRLESQHNNLQHLVAPTTCATFNPAVLYEHCLPEIPLEQPNPVERSSDYRLVTLNKYERPCLTGFNYERELRGLANAVSDEWLVENNREQLRSAASPKHKATSGSWFGWPNLDTGFAYVQGGSDRPANGRPACWNVLIQSAVISSTGADPYAIDSHTHWFAGTYGQYNHQGVPGNLMGNAEYLPDPRNATDPNVPQWP